jgi:outer membrane lipoprotein SlyB
MMQDQGAMSSGSQSSYGASSGGASASSKSPNATVAAIEVMPRSGGATTEGGSSGSAAMGSSSSGTTGSSPDRVYRVTLRLDDGSTQVVTQQTTPDFRTGDRVSLTGGVIQH